MNSLQVPDGLPSFLIPFVTLSYPTTTPAHPDSFHDSLYYGTGILDACLIVTCIATMAVFRDITRICIMEPFAKWKLIRDWEMTQHEGIDVNPSPKGSTIDSSDDIAGHKNGEHAPLTISRRDARRIHRKMSRFAEQGWSFIYYTVSFTFGVYLHYNFPTRMLHLADMWLTYPHIPLAGTVKFYYLSQIAFYIHQVFILNVEARRKDHVQMMVHHIITIMLLVGSYAWNLTRIGCIFTMLTDCSDVFLPLAKMLRYIALYTLCDVTFVVFLISWAITRHVLFIIAMKSFWVDSIRLVPEMWAPERGSYFSPLIHQFISFFLVIIQMLQVIWFVMICRVAYRVVTGQGASDDRSDVEDGCGRRE